MRYLTFHSGLLLVVLTTFASAQPARWYKGNTHTHTLWSDGNDFPEMITDWYVKQGYNFLALSDHNVLQAKEVWMSVAKVEAKRKALGKTTMEKYRARFDGDWVQTREMEGKPEVRLRKLEEYRPLFEKPGQFLLVLAEEISAKCGKAPLHMNALNLQEALKPIEGDTIPEVLRANLRAVQDQAKRTGVPMLAHINHPNFQWALTAEDLAEVLEENFFEVFNGHPLVHCEGDEARVGNEKLWDIANTLRITKLHAPLLYGVGTDDSHHYHGEESMPGRGWIMVRSDKLEAAALIAAMRAGDFYASSGVTLDDVSFSNNTLCIRIHAEPGVTYSTKFIGTPVEFDATTTDVASPAGDVHPTRRNYSADVGKVFAEQAGTDVAFQLTGKELFVRATITSSAPHLRPTQPGQTQMAWVQPVVFKAVK
jgi:hypothetical protein